MEFNLTEDQLLLQKTVKEFTEREIEPIAEQMDEERRLPDALITKMAKIGLFGMAIPEQYGGTEIGHLNCILACEQLSYSGTGAWWLVGFNNSIPTCIARFGSKELKERYLRLLCDGRAYAADVFVA